MLIRRLRGLQSLYRAHLLCMNAVSLQMILAQRMSVLLQKSYLTFLLSFRSVVPKAFGTTDLKGPINETSCLCLHVGPSFQASHFTSSVNLDQQVICVQLQHFVRSLMDETSYKMIRAVNSEQSPYEHQHPQQTSYCDNCILLPSFSCLCSWYAPISSAAS